jgi:tetratricopeptide (TPR) repeat protein
MYERMGKRELQLNDLLSLEQWAKQLNDRTRLATALTLRTRYYDLTSDFANAIAYARHAEQYLDDETMPEMAIKMRLTYFPCLLRVGMIDEYQKQEKRALDLAVRTGRRLDEARVLTVSGLFALDREQFTTGHESLEKALMISREVKDKKFEAYALGNVAHSLGAFKGNYALAGEYYEQAYAISREIGDRFSECTILANMGFNASMQGDLSKATRYYEQALLTAREIANLRAETYTLINLSALAGAQSYPSKAMEYARQAYGLSLKLCEPTTDGWVQYYLGRAHLLLGEYTSAREAFNKSIEIRNELRQPSLSMEPLAGLLEAARIQNDDEQASMTVEKILAHFDGGGTLEGTDEPLRVYHICYQYLSEQEDPRAQPLLQNAKQLLGTQVSKFSDEETRKRFIESFPWRRAIYEAASS